MGIFDAFSPDAIFSALTARMGIDPSQVQKLITEFCTEIETLRAEREAFRVGAANVVRHFDGELAAMREQLSRIERALGPKLVQQESERERQAGGTGDNGTSERRNPSPDRRAVNSS